MKTIKHPLAPIIDKDSRILILGSFPSVISRQQSFYYANPTNRFWQVMSSLFNEEIKDRELFCHKHHLALWDVIGSCTINNSDDASIKNVVVNDIDKLCDKYPIEMIACTGNKAHELLTKYFDLDIKYAHLPSTSSANAKMSLKDLCQAYDVIRETANEKD